MSATSSTAVVRAPSTGIQIAGTSLAEAERLAEHLVKGQMFKGKGGESVSRVITKFLVGEAYGLPPALSMSAIDVIDGKPTMTGQLQAALIDNHPDYDYRVEEQTDASCRVLFFKKIDGDWVRRGESSFSMEDAQRAGLAGKDNWRKYPAKMLFWRALTNGFDMFCPALQYGPVYTPEEMGSEEPPDEIPSTAVYVDEAQRPASGAPVEDAEFEEVPDDAPVDAPSPAETFVLKVTGGESALDAWGRREVFRLSGVEDWAGQPDLAPTVAALSPEAQARLVVLADDPAAAAKLNEAGFVSYAEARVPEGDGLPDYADKVYEAARATFGDPDALARVTARLQAFLPPATTPDSAGDS